MVIVYGEGGHKIINYNGGRSVTSVRSICK